MYVEEDEGLQKMKNFNSCISKSFMCKLISRRFWGEMSSPFQGRGEKEE